MTRERVCIRPLTMPKLWLLMMCFVVKASILTVLDCSRESNELECEKKERKERKDLAIAEKFTFNWFALQSTNKEAK